KGSSGDVDEESGGYIFSFWTSSSALFRFAMTSSSVEAFHSVRVMEPIPPFIINSAILLYSCKSFSIVFFSSQDRMQWKKFALYCSKNWKTVLFKGSDNLVPFKIPFSSFI